MYKRGTMEIEEPATERLADATLEETESIYLEIENRDTYYKERIKKDSYDFNKFITVYTKENIKKLTLAKVLRDSTLTSLYESVWILTLKHFRKLLVECLEESEEEE